MTIQLRDHVWPAKLIKSGDEEGISIPPGKTLKIETTPGGEEVLAVMCPPGKMWSARIIVEITETNG